MRDKDDVGANLWGLSEVVISAGIPAWSGRDSGRTGVMTREQLTNREWEFI
jgi:hypothetical protein